MSSKREKDEDALREKFRKENPEHTENIDNLFDQLDTINKAETKKSEEEEAKALKTWEDLIVTETETFKIKGVEFTIRKHATALEHLSLKNIKTPEEELRYYHSFIIEPEIPFDKFKVMDDYVVRFVEAKIKENFLKGLTQIALTS